MIAFNSVIFSNNYRCRRVDGCVGQRVGVDVCVRHIMCQCQSCPVIILFQSMYPISNATLIHLIDRQFVENIEEIIRITMFYE